jgi:hypothetical protein
VANEETMGADRKNPNQGQVEAADKGAPSSERVVPVVAHFHF